jgi:hypothetical protein
VVAEVGERAGFLLEQRAPGELVIEVRADLEEENAYHLREATAAFLDSEPGISRVVIDVRAVRECRLLARAELGEMQVHLKNKVQRTAWLAGTSRMRGMALVVVHAANDPNANVFVSPDQARAWLTDTVSRTDSQAKRLASLR